MDSINIYFYNANFFTVSGQTLEVEMNELSQGLKVIQRDILEISSREKMDDDHFEETMKVSPSYKLILALVLAFSLYVHPKLCSYFLSLSPALPSGGG